MQYKYVGFLRGLSFVVLIAALGYVGDLSNLTFLENPWIAGLIASIAAAIEHELENKKGKAFGVISIK